MNIKLISSIVIVVLFISIFTAIANAQGLNFLCFKKQNIIVTLKNDADVNKSKEIISKIPQTKVINIKYRDKEWSKKVNKYDLPNMENPFKNEFTVRVNKNTDINKIYNQIKEMDFVEVIKYDSDKKCIGR